MDLGKKEPTGSCWAKDMPSNGLISMSILASKAYSQVVAAAKANAPSTAGSSTAKKKRFKYDSPYGSSCFPKRAKIDFCCLIMKILDTVALVQNLPDLGLYKGQVGTIIEVYETTVLEVEFVDLKGKTYAVETLEAS